MKCQIQFSVKNKKNIINFLSVNTLSLESGASLRIMCLVAIDWSQSKDKPVLARKFLTFLATQ